jgi:hypothetical protein
MRSTHNKRSIRELAWTAIATRQRKDTVYEMNTKEDEPFKKRGT